MTKEETEKRIEDLEIDIAISKKVLGYLSGMTKTVYEMWIKRKEEEVEKLKGVKIENVK